MKYGCCIVETRPLPNLLEIITERHLWFLPDDWGLTCFLSTQNEHLIKPHMFKREIKKVIIGSQIDQHRYNNLLTNARFWELLEYDKALIFQHDSELFRTGIENYLQYDFIGAQDTREGCEGFMNGGLSLRDVKKMRDICSQHKYDGSMNEDWWFCQKLGRQQKNLIEPPFSIELNPIFGSLGAHAIDKYLTPEQCQQIRNQYR